MEGTMRNTDTQRPAKAEFILGAIADWINSYRSRAGLQAAFGRCTPDDVKQIAKDLGVPAPELRALASKGPHAADLLEKMLLALGVDPAAIVKTDPATMRDLQRLCSACAAKGRCQRELNDGTAAAHFHEFCPNAFTLDALLAQAKATRH
jgi:hypothetical protein